MSGSPEHEWGLWRGLFSRCVLKIYKSRVLVRELRYRGKFWVFPTKRLEPIWGLDKDRFVGLRGWVGGWGCLRIKRWGFEIARGSWSSNTTPVIYYKSTWIGDEDQNILIVICVWHLLFFHVFGCCPCFCCYALRYVSLRNALSVD